jgi:hypothetical protein
MDSSITTTEGRQLASYEAVIESGLRTFADVGNALLAIREGRLYRATHGTFEDYCRERWGMSKPYATQMIQAGRVVSNLRAVAIATIPANEAQARPLAALPDDEQAEAWAAATAQAETKGRRVTARDVEEVVESRKVTRSQGLSDGMRMERQRTKEAAELVARERMMSSTFRAAFESFRSELFIAKGDNFCGKTSIEAARACVRELDALATEGE